MYYGDGKGKTTAAIGLAIRAAGHGYKVLFIQFIKRDLNIGEYLMLKNISNITHIALGPGLGASQEEVIKHTETGLELIRKYVKELNPFLIVLDEFGVTVNRYGYPINKALEFIKELLENSINILITGKYMPKEFIEIADLVTEFRCIRHYYNVLRTTMPGLDF